MHPSFREIYEGSWIEELQQRITVFLNDPRIASHKNVPALLRAISSGVKN
jgi:hypothetical protein